MALWEKILRCSVLAGGAIAGVFGPWNMLLTVLAIMMVLDYIAGVIVAALGKSSNSEGGHLDSRAGFVGLAKKGFIVIIVLMATALDRAIDGEAMVFQTATAGYYCMNEGLSILENAAVIGLPVPDSIKQALEQFRERGRLKK